MGQLHNKSLRGNARTLRKGMTKEERHLWYDFLKGLPVMVHRQKIIGNYIVDFYIAESKIVIELDGSQHYEVQNRAADVKRDQYLSQTNMSSPKLPNLLGPQSFYFSLWQSHASRGSGHTLDSSLFPHPFIHIWPINKSPGSSLVSPVTSAAPTLFQQVFLVLLIRMATQLVSLLSFFTAECQLHQRDPS